MKNYRLIEKEGISIEITDPTIYQIHFRGEEVVVLRRYKNGGESISLCPPRETSFYHKK